MPWKEDARVNVLPYEKAIITLRERGYSYGEIAKWLSKELGLPVKRGQIYYVCKLEAVEAQERYEQAEARGEVVPRIIPSINLSEEEAEKIARTEDNARKKKGKKP